MKAGFICRACLQEPANNRSQSVCSYRAGSILHLPNGCEPHDISWIERIERERQLKCRIFIV